MQKNCNRESYALFPRERIVPTSGVSIGLYFKTDRKLKVLKNYIQSRKGETKSLFIGHGLPLYTKYYKQLWTVVVSNWLTYIMLLAFNLVLCLLKTIKVIAIPCIMMIAVFHSLCLSAQTPRKDSGVEGLLTNRPLNIGDAMPDDFWEQEFTIYNNGVLSKSNLSAYKGKLLVLDFWSTTCSPCLIHQSEINHYKKLYGDNINVVMVNPVITRDNLQKIDKLNAALKNRALAIRSIYSIIEDDYLHRLFPFNGFPFYVWIHPNGNIQTYTMRNLLDRYYQAPFIDPVILNAD